jgi:AcrR family transcriptional regulator
LLPDQQSTVPAAPAAAHTLPDIAATEERVHNLRADAQRNRERIIAAAVEVFAEHGLEASTAEIAERAGVGEATLFRRFASKDDLIMAIVEAQMDEVIELAADCVENSDPADGVERFLTAMIEHSVADRGVLESTKDACMVKPGLQSRRREILNLLTELVKRGQAAGTIRADLTGQDLGFLISAGASAAGMPFPGIRPDIWKRYLGIILDGLRPEGATKLRPGPPARRLFEEPTGD